MKLRFFGRGSGFADEHNSAYFVTNQNDLVIIDCPASTYQKLKHIDLQQYDKIYVLITHTHGDHSGGLGLLVQHSFFKQKKIINIIAPSKRVARDIKLLLTRIEGCQKDWFCLTTSKKVQEDWFCRSIKTIHSPQLKNKCFGYQLTLDSTNIIYTGDTSTLKPFLPYLQSGTEFYVDASVHDGIVHMKLEDALNSLNNIASNGVKVYLMHLDDPGAAEHLIANYHNIKLVTVE